MKSESIDALWKGHVESRFPAGLRGEEVDGIDLVMLDADIAGCVQSFVRRRQLDQPRLDILSKCHAEVTAISPKLSSEARLYFERLGQMAAAVLDHCGKRAV